MKREYWIMEYSDKPLAVHYYTLKVAREELRRFQALGWARAYIVRVERVETRRRK